MLKAKKFKRLTFFLGLMGLIGLLSFLFQAEIDCRSKSSYPPHYPGHWPSTPRDHYNAIKLAVKQINADGGI